MKTKVAGDRVHFRRQWCQESSIYVLYTTWQLLSVTDHENRREVARHRIRPSEAGGVSNVQSRGSTYLRTVTFGNTSWDWGTDVARDCVCSPTDTGVRSVQSRRCTGQLAAQSQKLSKENDTWMERGWKSSEFCPLANSGIRAAKLSELRYAFNG